MVKGMVHLRFICLLDSPINTLRRFNTIISCIHFIWISHVDTDHIWRDCSGGQLQGQSETCNSQNCVILLGLRSWCLLLGCPASELHAVSPNWFLRCPCLVSAQLRLLIFTNVHVYQCWFFPFCYRVCCEVLQDLSLADSTSVLRRLRLSVVACEIRLINMCSEASSTCIRLLLKAKFVCCLGLELNFRYQ